MRYFFGPVISDVFPTVTHRSKRFGPGSQLGEFGTISVCATSHRSSRELIESLRQQCWASISALKMTQDAISGGIVRPRSNCAFHWRNLVSFRNKHGRAVRGLPLFGRTQSTRNVGTE